jgi:hypothetical protein
VGSGTDSSGYVPSYSWEYNFSQTIVRANEIGVDGVIDTIAFQVGSRNATRQLAIYMVQLQTPVFRRRFLTGGRKRI